MKSEFLDFCGMVAEEVVGVRNWRARPSADCIFERGLGLGMTKVKLLGTDFGEDDLIRSRSATRLARAGECSALFRYVSMAVVLQRACLVHAVGLGRSEGRVQGR